MATLPDLNYTTPDPKRGFDQAWSGYLTTENAEHIAAMLRIALVGLRYTWGEFNEGMPGLGLLLDTGRTLTENAHDSSGISCLVSNGRAHIAVCDSYGMWGISSEMATQPSWPTEAQTETERAAIKWAVRLCVGHSASFATRALHIEQLVLAGDLTRWTIAVEGQR
jgi:hypothetical protein